MTLAVITFLLVVAIIWGLYWVVLLRPETAAHGAVRSRLRAGTQPARSRLTVFKKAQQLSDVPALNAMLRGSTKVSGHLQQLINQAGLKVTVGTVVLGCACCGVLVFFLLSRATGTVLAPLLVAAAAALVPYFYVRHKATKRMQRFEELFPEAIGLVIRALRAGHAFTTGLAMAAEETADPVGPEFRLVYDNQNFGMPMEDALLTFAQRIPLLDVRFFATAVLTQRDAGGNLAEVLENICSVIRDRFKVKRQVRVVTAHARITGMVLAGMPPFAALAMFFIVPEHMKTLWSDPLGVRLVLVAVVLQILGALIIRKVVDIKY